MNDLDYLQNPCRWRNRRMTRLIRPQKVGELAVKSEWREWSLQESILEFLNDLGWRSTLAWILAGLACVGVAFGVSALLRWMGLL